jgi:hypothetical protein
MVYVQTRKKMASSFLTEVGSPKQPWLSYWFSCIRSAASLTSVLLKKPAAGETHDGGSVVVDVAGLYNVVEPCVLDYWASVKEVKTVVKLSVCELAEVICCHYR